MNFPDQNYLHKIQEDLWQWPTSRSAVMVGAGFSLNSTPQAGVQSQFPLWNDILVAMFDEIYPESTNERQERKIRYFNTNALRIASEYDAMFNRNSLNALLQKIIPDTKHRPGNLHTLLLNLPWKDVLTTNYDTLLERTEVQGRAYQPVVSIEDLTRRTSPRIIKLHGSFPSKTPFIITEEDYRTYPDRFAPFVNTVQQILIENSLVLIGYSGDDPNFLQWTGWIRDHLGDSHAPIYLVGTLSLGNADRILLNRRGITPIDLSPLFQNTSFIGNKHSSSLEWFFRSLLKAKPQPHDEWPKPSDLNSHNTPNTPSNACDHILNQLPPIIGRRGQDHHNHTSNIPKINDQLDLNNFSSLLSRWIMEREGYPGWLVAPKQIRYGIWLNTKSWIVPLIEFTKDWSAADRVLVLRELNWRLDIAMVPLYDEISIAMNNAVIECYQQLDSDKKLTVTNVSQLFSHAPQTDIVEAWFELSFCLLRTARFMYDQDGWESIKQQIDKISFRFSMDTDALNHEEILWEVSTLDHQMAKTKLSEWEPSTNSPTAQMRKASLLAELDEVNDALLLAQDALMNIRRSLVNEGQNIGLLSIEGWCTYLIYIIQHSINLVSARQLQKELIPRWSELRAWDCDPRLVKQFFDEALSTKQNTILKIGKNTIPRFDPGAYRVTYHYNTDDYDESVTPFSYIRHFETVGLPIRLPNVDITRNTLVNACRKIIPYVGSMLHFLLVRAGKLQNPDSYEHLSRVSIGYMESESKHDNWYIQSLGTIVDRNLTSRNLNLIQKELLIGLSELVSRYALRFNESDLEKTFQLANKMYHIYVLVKDIDMSNSLNSFYKRLFEAADTTKQVGWISELVMLPIMKHNDDNAVHVATDDVDPLMFIHYDRCKDFLNKYNDDKSMIQKSINALLNLGINGTSEYRVKIINRLVSLRRLGLFTPDHENSLGQLIWSNVPTGSLPNLPFYFFSYIKLPHLSNIDVLNCIRNEIINLNPKLSVTVNANQKMRFTSPDSNEERAIYELAMSSKPVIKLHDENTGFIEWKAMECKALLSKIFVWCNNEIQILDWEEPSSWFIGTAKDYICSSMRYVDLLIARAIFPNMNKLSQDDFSNVITLINDLKKKEIYLIVCLPYMLISKKSQINYVKELILEGFSQKSVNAVEGCARAIRHWVHLSHRRKVPFIPKILIDTLIQRIIFRKYVGIQECIKQTSYLLVEKPDSFSRRQVKLLISSLDSWLDVLKLPIHDEETGDFPEHERPYLRSLLPMLCIALTKWLRNKRDNFKEPSEILSWKNECEKDPLPEVRRAFEVWKIRLNDL